MTKPKKRRPAIAIAIVAGEPISSSCCKTDSGLAGSASCGVAHGIRRAVNHAFDAWIRLAFTFMCVLPLPMKYRQPGGTSPGPTSSNRPYAKIFVRVAPTLAARTRSLRHFFCLPALRQQETGCKNSRFCDALECDTCLRIIISLTCNAAQNIPLEPTIPLFCGACTSMHTIASRSMRHDVIALPCVLAITRHLTDIWNGFQPAWFDNKVRESRPRMMRFCEL